MVLVTEGEYMHCMYRIFLTQMGLYEINVIFPYRLAESDILALDMAGIDLLPICYLYMEEYKMTSVKFQIASCKHCLPDISLLCTVYNQTEETYNKSLEYLKEMIKSLYETEYIEALPQTAAYAEEITKAAIANYFSIKCTNKIHIFCNIDTKYQFTKVQNNDIIKASTQGKCEKEIKRKLSW